MPLSKRRKPVKKVRGKLIRDKCGKFSFLPTKTMAYAASPLLGAAREVIGMEIIRPGDVGAVPSVPAAAIRAAGMRPITDNPEEFYHWLNINQLAGFDRVDFFTVYPDAQKIFGNYELPYIQKKGVIQGIKIDLQPRNFLDTELTIGGIKPYSDILNLMLEGTVELVINDAPIFTWKLHDIGPTFDVTNPFVTPITFELNYTYFLTAPKFTVFKDLYAAKQLRADDFDRIKVSVTFPTALPTGGEGEPFPEDLQLGCLLLIRPHRYPFVS